MSVFRIAVSALTVGLAIFYLVVHRAEVPGISMELMKNPEFWVAVGLVLVLILLVGKGVPAMLTKLLDARALAISKELDEAKKLRDEAAEMLAAYARKASQAESEAVAIIAEAKAEAERFAKETRAQLRAQIDRRSKMAQDKIAMAEASALNEIRGLAADASIAAAEKLIAARMDEKRATSLVQESIKDLPEKLN
jgi:F-type H+-transporting ATPase subunit b